MLLALEREQVGRHGHTGRLRIELHEVGDLQQTLLGGAEEKRAIALDRSAEGSAELALLIVQVPVERIGRRQRFFAVVKRAAAHVAVRRPLLARVDDAVGLVEALAAARLDVPPGLLVWVEARDVGAGRVDFRIAGRHPLGHGTRDAGRFLDPDGRHRP